MPFLSTSQQTKVLGKLDFDTVRERLAAQCSTSMGAEEARRLLPSPDPQVVRHRLSLTSEGRGALDHGLAPPLDGLADLRPICQRLDIGADLSGHELIAVRDFLAGVRGLRQHLARREMNVCPKLSSMGQRLEVFPELEEILTHALDDDGQVLDRASARLGYLRQRIRRLRDSIRERMERMARGPGMERLLQERIVAFRRDRPCLAVRVEQKRAVAGILHDASASGATVFIEPAEVVEDGNELQALRTAEEHEVARILSELSGRVGTRREALEGDLRLVAEIDFVLARGRLSAVLDGIEPVLWEEPRVHLLAARHPLIDPAQVVHNDLWVGEDYDVLLITGPNAGGKTVALKTVGLLVTMAQAGLHIPAEAGSGLGIFEEIRADIGDEQSIEQSLSTFSAHMRNLAEVLAGAGPRTLVLLDEIGWGTDPTEGAVLAMAILGFLRRRGARVIATTHLNELKGFAAGEERTVNAAMEFDSATLSPTYRLRLGQPGRSYALTIAARNGLPPEVIQQAQGLLPEATVKLEEVLAQAEQARRELEEERASCRRALAEAEQARRRAEEEAQRLEAARQQALRGGFEEATQIVREARTVAREVIEDLRRQDREGRATQLASEQLRAKDEEIEEARRHWEQEAAGPPRDVELRPGQVVAVRSVGGRGILLSEPDAAGRVEVRIGSIKATVDSADLEILDAEPIETSIASETVSVEKAITAPREISLRGMAVEEALMALEKFMDDALLAGHEQVRIIHGKGTGILRDAVREYLRQCPRVRAFHFAEQYEGGVGVTVAELE